jgi:hypothetical protein
MNKVMEVPLSDEKAGGASFPNAELAGNVKHEQIALFAEAALPLDELKEWVIAKRIRHPTLVLFAQFKEGEFHNQRLDSLLSLGFDSYVIGQPSPELVTKLCGPIRGFIVRESKKFGHICLKENVLSRGSEKVSFTKKQLLLLRMLIEARESPIARTQLMTAYGYGLDTNTHTIETQLFRVREKLKQIGLAGVLVYEKQVGYRLLL